MNRTMLNQKPADTIKFTNVAIRKIGYMLNQQIYPLAALPMPGTGEVFATSLASGEVTHERVVPFIKAIVDYSGESYSPPKDLTKGEWYSVRITAEVTDVLGHVRTYHYIGYTSSEDKGETFTPFTINTIITPAKEWGGRDSKLDYLPVYDVTSVMSDDVISVHDSMNDGSMNYSFRPFELFQTMDLQRFPELQGVTTVDVRRTIGPRPSFFNRMYNVPTVWATTAIDAWLSVKEINMERNNHGRTAEIMRTEMAASYGEGRRVRDPLMQAATNVTGATQPWPMIAWETLDQIDPSFRNVFMAARHGVEKHPMNPREESSPSERLMAYKVAMLIPTLAVRFGFARGKLNFPNKKDVADCWDKLAADHNFGYSDLERYDDKLPDHIQPGNMSHAMNYDLVRYVVLNAAMPDEFKVDFDIAGMTTVTIVTDEGDKKYHFPTFCDSNISPMRFHSVKQGCDFAQRFEQLLDMVDSKRECARRDPAY